MTWASGGRATRLDLPALHCRVTLLLLLSALGAPQPWFAHLSNGFWHRAGESLLPARKGPEGPWGKAGASALTTEAVCRPA